MKGVLGQAFDVVTLVSSFSPPPSRTGVAPRQRTPLTEVTIRVTLDPAVCDGAPQGYSLATSDGVWRICAADATGAFYGLQTIVQLLRLSKDPLTSALQHTSTSKTAVDVDGVKGISVADAVAANVPFVEISDWPSIATRGVMIDVSRTRVPAMKELFALVDYMASLKLNHLQLYTEHAFAYEQHEAVWQHASPLTAAQVRSLDTYCWERHVELVPNQNSLGHMHRWLKHDTYRPLAECPEGLHHPFTSSPEAEPFGLCPADPAAVGFVTGLHAELRGHFRSNRINVGLDEPVDLKMGRSRKLAGGTSPSDLYLEYLLTLHGNLSRQGAHMMCWADYVSQHPHIIPSLPTKDFTLIEWGYDDGHPFKTNCQRFKHAGVPFYVCAGTSSWSSFAGRTRTSLANMRDAARAGLRNGAVGFLIADWGDNGHLQPPSVSLAPLAFGAHYSWAEDEPQEGAVTDAITAAARTAAVVASMKPPSSAVQRLKWLGLGILAVLLLPVALVVFAVLFVLGLLLLPFGRGVEGQTCTPTHGAPRTYTPSPCEEKLMDGTSTDGVPFAALLDDHVFRDRAGVMGRVVMGLGNAYSVAGPSIPNSSILFWSVLIPEAMTDNDLIKFYCIMTLGFYPWPAFVFLNFFFGRFLGRYVFGMTARRLHRTMGFVEHLESRLSQAEMDRPDAPLVAAEYRHVAAMLKLACAMWIARLRHGIHRPVSSLPQTDRQALAEDLEGLLENHKRLWKCRSRPGGLDESCGFLQRVIDQLEEGGRGGTPDPPAVSSASPLLEGESRGRIKSV